MASCFLLITMMTVCTQHTIENSIANTAAIKAPPYDQPELSVLLLNVDVILISNIPETHKNE